MKLKWYGMQKTKMSITFANSAVIQSCIPNTSRQHGGRMFQDRFTG